MNVEAKWIELMSMSNIDDRVIAIHEDIKNNVLTFMELAEDDPYRFFKLLSNEMAFVK
jgi:hypothetical protein